MSPPQAPLLAPRGGLAALVLALEPPPRGLVTAKGLLPSYWGLCQGRGPRAQLSVRGPVPCVP